MSVLFSAEFTSYGESSVALLQVAESFPHINNSLHGNSSPTLFPCLNVLSFFFFFNQSIAVLNRVPTQENILRT